MLPNLLLDCSVLLLNQKTVGPTVTSMEPEEGISSTAKIIEEECLASKTVEDEDRTLIDTNDTIDLGKIVVNEVKRKTLTQDKI